jgi:hypothetical protein
VQLRSDQRDAAGDKDGDQRSQCVQIVPEDGEVFQTSAALDEATAAGGMTH